MPEGGTEVHHEKFALRDVSSRLPDAQSLQVVGMLLLDGPAVLTANASEDVRLGLIDILCKQHQLFVVSDQSSLPINPACRFAALGVRFFCRLFFGLCLRLRRSWAALVTVRGHRRPAASSLRRQSLR